MLSTLGKAVGSAMVKILISLASEKFLIWLFFKLAESLAKSTKTDFDDEAVSKLKDVYYSKKD